MRSWDDIEAVQVTISNKLCFLQRSKSYIVGCRKGVVQLGGPDSFFNTIFCDLVTEYTNTHKYKLSSTGI